MISRTDALVKEMRRKRLGRRHDKPKMVLNHTQKLLNVYETEINTDNIKEILEAVRKGNPDIVTVEVLKKEMLDAIEMIYSHHNSENSVLKHNCCFEIYYQKIKMLIEVMISKEYLYAHMFGKE